MTTETRILRGAPLAAVLREQIATGIDALIAAGGRSPVLATVMVGSAPESVAYRGSIVRACARVGVTHRPFDLSPTATASGLVATLRRLNEGGEITGVLVLMPLPRHLRQELVVDTLAPLKDIDGIAASSVGRLRLGLPTLPPACPRGGIELLDHHGVEIAGAHVVVIGRSSVVGAPLATMLTARDATVTVCHRRTRHLADICRQGDVVAVAAGRAGLLTRDMVRAGTTVLDFGTNVVGDRLVGDAAYDELLGHAGAITPVPGGTGPVTSLVLARNTVAAGFAQLTGSLDGVARMPAAGFRATLAGAAP